jgi:hypothetical protein
MENFCFYFSLKALFNALENLVVTESQLTGIPWLSLSRLNELFSEKYGMEIEDFLQSQKSSLSLILILRKSQIFSIYRTQNMEELYIALLREIISAPQQSFSSHSSSRSYQLKRPWKIDGRLVKMLRSEEIQVIEEPKKTKTLDQPQLKLQIESLEDLKQTLVKLLKILARSSREQSLTVAALTSKFYQEFQQPLRSVVRKVCPEAKLLDLLQTLPEVNLKQVDRTWQITLNSPEMNS